MNYEILAKHLKHHLRGSLPRNKEWWKKKAEMIGHDYEEEMERPENWEHDLPRDGD